MPEDPLVYNAAEQEMSRLMAERHALAWAIQHERNRYRYVSQWISLTERQRRRKEAEMEASEARHDTLERMFGALEAKRRVS